MLRLTSAESLYSMPGTPWARAVGKLVGKCQVKGITDNFVRRWVVREAEFTKSGPQTAELARLADEGVQNELLADLRINFPRLAAEWFAGLAPSGVGAGGPVEPPDDEIGLSRQPPNSAPASGDTCPEGEQYVTLDQA